MTKISTSANAAVAALFNRLVVNESSELEPFSHLRRIVSSAVWPCFSSCM